MKEYSKIFDHYYGLQYDNNVNAVFKVHELMEKAGIEVTSPTTIKLDAYSDKRPFRVHYFISKTGKKLKWLPTNSADKLAKMTLKPAEWWIEQLEGSTTTAPTVNIPNNWLDEQAKYILGDRILSAVNHLGSESETVSKIVDIINPVEDVAVDESEPAISYDYDDLPF